MNKRIPITNEHIKKLKELKIPEMWNPRYAGEIVQDGDDLFVSLGGQGHMDETFKEHSDIEYFCGGVIDGHPFVVNSFYYEKRIYDNEYILYMKIHEVRYRGTDIDKSSFLRKFKKMIIDYGMVLNNSIRKDCCIINNPKFKNVINL